MCWWRKSGIDKHHCVAKVGAGLRNPAALNGERRERRPCTTTQLSAPIET